LCKIWGNHQNSNLLSSNNRKLDTISIVERLTEYERAARMPALQHFNPDLEDGDETCADILSDAKCFILCFRKETFCTRCFRINCFTIVCNIEKYIMMGQDLSLGQFYDV
jgi:hypothetical protein